MRAHPRRQRRGVARPLSFLLGLLLLATAGGTWSWHPAADAGATAPVVSVSADGVPSGRASTADDPSRVPVVQRAGHAATPTADDLDAIDVAVHTWSPWIEQPVSRSGAAADEILVGDALRSSIKDRAPPVRAV